MNDDLTVDLVQGAALAWGHATPLSPAGQYRPIVLVMGMRASGASLCSNILRILGVDMADEVSISAHDKFRRCEHGEIVAFHDRILAYLNRGEELVHDLPLPPGWWADPNVAAVRREMVASLKGRLDEHGFGFKDPRTIRLMPLWYQICDDLKLAPKILLCLRHPAKVVHSLAQRTGLSPAIGERRWLVYMLDFFRYVGDQDYCIIECEKWLEDRRANLARIENFLGVDRLHLREEVDWALSNIIGQALRHQEMDFPTLSFPMTQSVYDLAVRAERDDVSQRRIREIARDFFELRQIEMPLVRAFEDASTLAARASESERQLIELQTALAEREERLTAAIERAVSAETQLANRTAEMEAERACLAEAGGRSNDRLATLQRVEEEAADLRAALADRAQALVMADERAFAAEAQQAGAEERALVAKAELAARTQDLAEMRATLVERETELSRLSHEVAAVASARELLQIEAAELRETLARNEREAREYASSEYRLRGDVLRLEKSERMLQMRERERTEALLLAVQEGAESACVVATLRREISVVRKQLDKATTGAAEAARDIAARQERLNRATAGAAEAAREGLVRAEEQARALWSEAETVRSEMVLLHQEIDAARRVSAKFVSAFRTDPARSPEPPAPRIGTWRKMRSLLGFR